MNAFVTLLFAALTINDVVGRVARLTPATAATGGYLNMAGKYTSTSEELRRKAGPALSGTELHLFPDGTYMHVEWSDISAPVIDDKGTWQIGGSGVLLRSDSSITWRVGLPRQYAPLHRPQKRREILLLSIPQLEYFEKHATDPPNDPEFMLLVTALALEKRYTASEATRVKAQLMKEAWNPKYFR